MLMKKFLSFLTAIIIFSFATPSFAGCPLPGVTKSMLNADYWLLRAKDADKILFSAEDIEKFNAQISATPKTYCANLLEYPQDISKDDLIRAVSPEPNFHPKNYIDGKRATQRFLQELTDECNICGISENNLTRFGFAADNLQLRTLPTLKSSHKTAHDKLFDRYTESSVKIWEPLIILHSSKSGEWLFVRTRNCSGWVQANGVAICDRATFEKYIKMPFIIVTGAKIYPRIGLMGKRYELLMGTKLPLAENQDTIVEGVASSTSRVVLLPESDENGNFKTHEILIPVSADIHEGYLDYTQENIIRAAFKLLGEPYGWGGNFGQWDCSALIHDVYSVFGFELPRNSRVQTRIPSFHADVKKYSAAEKEKLLSELPAGAFVQMPGHIMMYIGTARGKPYIIHETHALYSKTGHEIYLNCAVVTDMNLYRANGKKIMDCIENINAIK